MEQLHDTRTRGLLATKIVTAPQWQAPLIMAYGASR
jgi:hypothetical protein